MNCNVYGGRWEGDNRIVNFEDGPHRPPFKSLTHAAPCLKSSRLKSNVVVLTRKKGPPPSLPCHCPRLLPIDPAIEQSERSFEMQNSPAIVASLSSFIPCHTHSTPLKLYNKAGQVTMCDSEWVSDNCVDRQFALNTVVFYCVTFTSTRLVSFRSFEDGDGSDCNPPPPPPHSGVAFYIISSFSLVPHLFLLE